MCTEAPDSATTEHMLDPVVVILASTYNLATTSVLYVGYLPSLVTKYSNPLLPFRILPRATYLGNNRLRSAVDPGYVDPVSDLPNLAIV